MIHWSNRKELVLSSAGALFLLAALSGCALFGVSRPIVPKDMANHVIMIRETGEPLDPTGNTSCQEPPGLCKGIHGSALLHSYRTIVRYPEDRYREYVLALLKNVQKHFGEKDRKVLIFVHGGMNILVAANERADALREQILQAEEGYYPIIINWDSGLLSSYQEHVLHVRQGVHEPYGWWSAPTYLTMDLVRGLTRAPVVWWNLIRNDIQTLPWSLGPLSQERDDASQIGRELVEDWQLKRPDAFPIRQGQGQRTGWEMAAGLIKYVGTFPLKLAIAPVVDAAGLSAWNNMRRRTEMLFHTEDEFAAVIDKPKSKAMMDMRANPGKGLSHIQPDGALSVFMRELSNIINTEKPSMAGGRKWTISLVGHSMGTIVMNRMIREFGDMPFDNLIYMGAACTIADYESSVFPYLMKKNGGSQVFHLVLHELAESGEAWDEYTFGIDLPPRGSLLVWIDSFLGNPLAPLDLTLGRYTNLMRAIHDTPLEIRRQISVKKFEPGKRAGKTNPTKHGEFSEPFKFWKHECWEVESSDGCFR